MRNHKSIIGFNAIRAGLACVLAMGLAVQASARVAQSVRLTLHDEMGNLVDVDSDFIEVPLGVPITNAIFASLPEPPTGLETYSSSGSVGVFGQLGVEAQMFAGTGRLFNQVNIASDEHVNLTGVEQNAVANFIIDGGSASMIAGDGSIMGLTITLGAEIFVGNTRIRSTVWQGGFELEVLPGSGGNPTFSTFGEDIRATFDGNSSVDIDFSFQTFDIGPVPANGRVELGYGLSIRADTTGFVEGVFWQFSDPLLVQQGGGQGPAPTVVFGAVPEPLTAALGLMGLGVLSLATRWRA